MIAKKYGIAQSTVANIKKNRVELDSFKQRMTGMGVKKDVATKEINFGTYKDWTKFLQGQRSRGNRGEQRAPNSSQEPFCI